MHMHLCVACCWTCCCMARVLPSCWATKNETSSKWHAIQGSLTSVLCCFCCCCSPIQGNLHPDEGGLKPYASICQPAQLNRRETRQPGLCVEHVVAWTAIITSLQLPRASILASLDAVVLYYSIVCMESASVCWCAGGRMLGWLCRAGSWGCTWAYAWELVQVQVWRVLDRQRLYTAWPCSMHAAVAAVTIVTVA
jgi:hypothetical protein